jgi:hypothetical protein
MKKKPFIRPEFAYRSEEYNRMILDVAVAKTARNQRNLYTQALMKGRNVTYTPIPTDEQRALLKEFDAWVVDVQQRAEGRLVKDVLSATRKLFPYDKTGIAKLYYSKLLCLIWWDICERRELKRADWREALDDRLLDSPKADDLLDADILEHALFLIGYPPRKVTWMVRPDIMMSEKGPGL